MKDAPMNPDREQQRRDNVESRRQSGLDPLPRDRKEDDAEEQGEADREERDA